MKLIIDGNILLYSSIFVWRKKKTIPINFFFCKQLFKYLKKFDPEEVYIAADAGGSWRKAIYPEYKANRKPFREKYPDIPWKEVFNNYSNLLDDLQMHTPYIPIQIKHVEGDDIISYLCRYKKGDKVIVTRDKDIRQLLVLPEVSIALPVRGGKVKELVHPEESIDEKIKKGDQSDNISKATTFSEHVRNELLVDLLNLPPSIDLTIKNYLANPRLEKIIDPNEFVNKYNYKFLKKEEMFNLLKGGKNG